MFRHGIRDGADANTIRLTERANVKSWWLSLVLYGLGIGATGGQAISPQKIDPPLGLFWGESQKSIEEKNTPITERTVVMQRDAWTVDRFPDSGLKKAILYFGKEKTLVEVELQYDEPTWSIRRFPGIFRERS